MIHRIDWPSREEWTLLRRLEGKLVDNAEWEREVQRRARIEHKPKAVPLPLTRRARSSVR